MTDTLYIPVSVKEHPKEDNWYITVGHFCSHVAEFRDGMWHNLTGDYNLWLKPVSKQEFVREIARKAWNTAVEWVDMVDNGGHFAPDLETYISKL